MWVIHSQKIYAVTPKYPFSPTLIVMFLSMIDWR